MTSTLQARSSGVWAPVSSVSARVSGVWTPVQAAWAKVSGVWTLIWTSLTCSASGPASGSAPIGVNATTTTVTVTPAGGAPPYTYLWSYLSGSSNILPNAPTSAITDFTDDGNDATSVFRCVVTDSLGATAHADVNVFTTHF